MLERVVQRFLRDMVELFLHRVRHERRVLHALLQQLSLDAATRLHRLQAGLDRARQPHLLQVHRPQLEDEQAHLPQRFLRGVAQIAQVVGRLGRLPHRQQAGRRLGVEGHAVEVLRHRVVQLARQPVALLRGRGSLRLLAEPGGLDGKRGLVGHRLDEVDSSWLNGRGLMVVQAERAVRPVAGEHRHGQQRPEHWTMFSTTDTGIVEGSSSFARSISRNAAVSEISTGLRCASARPDATWPATYPQRCRRSPRSRP